MAANAEPTSFSNPRLLFARQHHVLDLIGLVATHANFETTVHAIAKNSKLLAAAAVTDRGRAATAYFVEQGVEVPHEVEVYVNYNDAYADIDAATNFPCVNVCVHGPHGEEYVAHYDMSGWHPGLC
jgi:hypothetical protein